MASIQTSTSLPQVFEQPTSVTQLFNQFHVVRTLWLRRLFVGYPIIVGLFIVVDWFFLSGTLLLNDRAALFSYLAVGLAAIFFVQLYQQVPETLRALWDRSILRDAAQQPVTTEVYAHFIAEFDERLNGRWSWVAGITVLVVSRLILIFLGQIRDWNPVIVSLGSLSYFIDGIAVWKLTIIAITVTRLPQKFKLAVQAAHPDQSGGLGPLGDLCFINALVLLSPTLFFALAVIIGSSPELQTVYPIFSDQSLNYAKLIEYGVFHAVLMALLLLELIVFLLPLYDIHREMTRQGARQRRQLDALAQQISQINLELLTSPSSTNPSDVQKQLDTLKWIRQVYDNNLRIPTWPFNREVLLKFITSQAIPLLSLTGLGKPILEAIKVIANFLP